MMMGWQKLAETNFEWQFFYKNFVKSANLLIIKNWYTKTFTHKIQEFFWRYQNIAGIQDQ